MVKHGANLTMRVKICMLQGGKRGRDLTPTIYKGKIRTLPSNSPPSKVSLSYFNMVVGILFLIGDLYFKIGVCLFVCFGYGKAPRMKDYEFRGPSQILAIPSCEGFT